MIEKKKWAIAGSSGGMRCVEGAGARYKFAELGFPNPDIEVDISGNIPNAAYTMAGQHHLGWRIWTADLPTDSEFIRADRFPQVLNVDRMVDEEFAVRCPLDENAFRRSPTKHFFATTREQTGKTRWFTNADIERGIKPLEIVRAGTALVGLTRSQAVEIDGELHSDGVASTTIGDCIRVALEAGADYVVAIDCNDDSMRRRFRREFNSSGWSDRVALIQAEDSPANVVSTNIEDLQKSFYAGARGVLKAIQEHEFLQNLFRGTSLDSRRTAA